MRRWGITAGKKMKMREEMKKVLMFMVVLCLVACNPNAPEGGSSQEGGYVNLGLPSGTLWKSVNELNPEDAENGLYTYDEAFSAFGENLPTREQCFELRNACTWTWTGNGYKVVSTNGNSITLPAKGYRDPEGGMHSVGSYGYYWSPVPDGSDKAYYMVFYNGKLDWGNRNRSCGLSVRLVKK